MLRKLGIFEKAMIIANRHAPFNIVSVLLMKNAPSPEVVQEALSTLQARHPLLRVRIVKGKFKALTSPNIPFTLIERENNYQWQSVAEQEMMHSFDHKSGPLIRASYIFSGGEGDLILNIHHGIIDAVSGMNLLHEFLLLCSGEDLQLPELEFPPAMETKFPPLYKGISRITQIAAYTVDQLLDMGRFMWQTRNKRVPPVRLGGRGHISTLILAEDLADSLSRHCRKQGLTLNSLLNASLILSVNRHLYDGSATPTRTFSFADLRPYTQPPTPPEQLANYISMMGYTVEVDGEKGIWELAKQLHAKIYHSLKFGDKFSAVLMSKGLLDIFTKTRAMRFGATALNYSGNIPLQTRYGEIRLSGLHGFVSGYDLGPEVASQSRLFNQQIWWDFIYLDTDMDAALAETITAEIATILTGAIQTSE